MPIPDNTQRERTAREAAAAALDAQRELRSTPASEGAPDASEAQRELRDNQVRR
jgi:hypothetical protein